MTSLETLLKEGTKVLEQHKIQEARLDAWLLLEYVTRMNRAFYFAHSADRMDEEKSRQIPGTDPEKSSSCSIAAYYPPGIFYGI